MKITSCIAIFTLLCSLALQAASLDKEAQELASNDIPFDRLKPNMENPYFFTSQTVISFKPDDYTLCKLTEYKGPCIEINESGEYDFLYVAPQHHKTIQGANYQKQYTGYTRDGRGQLTFTGYHVYQGDNLVGYHGPDSKEYTLTIRIYRDNKDQSPQEIKKDMMNQDRLSLPLNLSSGSLVQFQINVVHWQVDLKNSEILLSPKTSEFLAKSQERKFTHLQKENDVLKQKFAEQACSLQEAFSRIQALEATITSMLRVMDSTFLGGVTPLTLASGISSFAPSEDTTRVPSPNEHLTTDED